MAIETIGGMNTILKNGQADKWVKNADLSLDGKVHFQDFAPTPKTNESFGEMLANSLAEVNSLQTEANSAIQKLASGQSKDIHETLMAVEKAEIAFKTMNQIRSKVIEAYQEVMRMQV